MTAPRAGGNDRPGTFRSASGFTLLEMLIAAAILLLVLAAIGGLLVSSLRGYGTSERITDRQQDVESAVAVMSYDLGLAGFRGTAATDFASQDFGADPTLEIAKGAGDEDPDTLTIRYFEDASRRYGATDPCTSYCEVRYEVGSDANGVSVLYRVEGDGSGERRGILQDLANLKVVEYIQRNGVHVAAAAGVAVPAQLAGLNIELTLADGDVWRFPIGVANAQSAVAN